MIEEDKDVVSQIYVAKFLILFHLKDGMKVEKKEYLFINNCNSPHLRIGLSVYLVVFVLDGKLGNKVDKPIQNTQPNSRKGELRLWSRKKFLPWSQ